MMGGGGRTIWARGWVAMGGCVCVGGGQVGVSVWGPLCVFGRGGGSCDLHRLSQAQRDMAAAAFGSSPSAVMFAIDVVACGLDFPDASLVKQKGGGV